MHMTWEFNYSECKLLANALSEFVDAGAITSEEENAFAKLFAAFAMSEKVRLECE